MASKSGKASEMKSGSNSLILFGSFLILMAGFYIIFENHSLLDFFGKNTDYKALLQKGRIFLEEGSENAIHKAMENFAEVASQSEKYRDEALFSIGEAYEKLGMLRMAMKKYMRLLKKSQNLSHDLKARLNFKVAKLQVMTLYKDEAYIRFLLMLHSTHKRSFRSEIYTELG